MIEFLQRSAGFRAAFVSTCGVILTLAALASATFSSRVVFTILGWPIAFLLWLFPAPCFDLGVGLEPFCEGTPVQILAAGVGLVISVVFYCFVVWAGLRLILHFGVRPNTPLEPTAEKRGGSAANR